MERTARRQSVTKASRNRSVRPLLEALEDRMLLYAVNGDVFSYGVRMTWSIMPDGTNLGGVASNLVSTLNSDIGAGNWLQPLEDAFAQWENVANVNFSQVSDNGSALGAGNYQQGSSVIGDIRIGGLALSPNILALTFLPPPSNGGSESGDIIFNTSQNWNSSSGYDLETVALHEIGHDMGLGESSVTNAVMYPYYGGIQQSLASDDIAGAQSIWSARQEDPFVKNYNNLNFANAANLNPYIVTSSNQVYLPGLNVASQADTYWFKVTTPANASSNFTAQVQSTNLSELSPRVAIFSAGDVGLVQTIAPSNAYGTTIDATITNATPNTTYYVRVTGSNIGASGTGAYALMLNMGSQAIPPGPPPYTTVLDTSSSGGGVQYSMTVGLGSQSKGVELATEVANVTNVGLQTNPSLTTTINTVTAELATTGALGNGAFDAALLGLLQDIPGAVLNGTAIDSSQSSDKGGTASVSMVRLKAILTPFFVDLESLLNHFQAIHAKG
jgi:hypothetical protein